MPSFRESVTVYIDRNLSPAARSQHLAGAARGVLGTLISSGRASPNYDTIVDGNAGASEDSVKPEGRITYLFSGMGQAVLFGITYLRDRSPVQTGAFRNAWVIAVNGREVPYASIQPKSIPNDAEVFIYNKSAFARKVDVQFVGNKRLKYSVPPGAMREAVTAVRQRFGNSVTVSTISSVTFPGQWTIKRGRQAGTKTQTPALVITSR